HQSATLMSAFGVKADKGGSSQALRFRRRSLSQAWPPVFIQFDASSSEEPSKISSEGAPSSTAHTDQTAACGAFRTISFGSSSWPLGTFSKILAMPANMLSSERSWLNPSTLRRTAASENQPTNLFASF